MRLVLLWIIIGAIAIASGVAVLSNTIDIKAQQMGVLFIPCGDNTVNCKNLNPTNLNSATPLSDDRSESMANPWVAKREYSAMVETNDFGTPQGNDDYGDGDLKKLLVYSNLENGN